MVQDRRLEVPNPPSPSFHLKLSPELREWLRGEAFRRKVSQAEVIRKAVEKERESTEKEPS